MLLKSEVAFVQLSVHGFIFSGISAPNLLEAFKDLLPGLKVWLSNMANLLMPLLKMSPLTFITAESNVMPFDLKLGCAFKSYVDLIHVKTI